MDRVEVKVVAESGAKLPQYMTEGSAGMDVYAELTEDIIIKPLERVLIPTGLKDGRVVSLIHKHRIVTGKQIGRAHV